MEICMMNIISIEKLLSTDEIERLIGKAQRAVQSANDKDDELIDVIRADL